MLALLIIIIVLAVLLLIPLGVDGGYSEGVPSLSIKIGPFRIRLLPRIKKPSRNKKAKKAKKTSGEEKPAKQGKSGKKPSSPQEILELVKLGLKALGRLRRKLSIDYLRLRYTAASGDPFTTAMKFAVANAAAGSLFHLVDQAFNVKERDYGINSSFFSDKSGIDLWLTATLTLLDIFYVALALGVDYLKIKIRKRRELRAKERTEENG